MHGRVVSQVARNVGSGEGYNLIIVSGSTSDKVSRLIETSHPDWEGGTGRLAWSASSGLSDGLVMGDDAVIDDDKWVDTEYRPQTVKGRWSLRKKARGEEAMLHTVMTN